MIEEQVIIRAEVGLHARPAAAFVQEAQKHECEIEVEYMGRKADGKSILQVLGLGVKSSKEIVIRANGAGESEAVAALISLLNITR